MAGYQVSKCRRNVYYDDSSASRFEGEQEDIIVTKTDLSGTSKPQTAKPPDTAAEEDNSEAETPAPRVRKPSQRVQDLLEGKGTWSSRSKAQKTFPGIQLPTTEEADVVDWATNTVDEYALAAETTNSEALEPLSLSEAKSRPDWKLWEKAIEEKLPSWRR